jgi:hypothetical protein
MTMLCKHMSLQILLLNGHVIRLNVNGMKSNYKLHVNMITILTWCHIISFALNILCDLSKATKGICDHMCHL